MNALSLILLGLLGSSLAFAGQESGAGPRPRAQALLMLSPENFRVAVLEGINNGEVELNGEKFQPGLIDLKKRTFELQSKLDLNKAITLSELPAEANQ